MQHDLVALLHQCAGGGEAEAIGGTGDEDAAHGVSLRGGGGRAVKQLLAGCSMRELGCGFPRSGTVRIHGCLVCADACPSP
ncbi:hypothetical protein ACVIDN_000354 [Rhizobium brockwellii]